MCATTRSVMFTHLFNSRYLPLKLADKVMKGLDYFMRVNVTYRRYLESFERLFSLRGMRGFKARYFSGNAMRYLKRKVADRYGAEGKSPPFSKSEARRLL